MNSANNNEVKIAFYYNHYVPYLEDQLIHISKLGFKVDYFVGGFSEHRKHWQVQHNSTSKHRNYSLMLLSSRIKIDTKYAGIRYFDPKLLSIILREKYDFFIIEFSEPITPIVSIFLKIVGSKLISWNGMCVTSPNIIRKLAEPFVCLCANLSDYFIARTIYAKKYLMQKGVDFNRIRVITHGVDTEKFNLEKKDNLKERLKLKNKSIVLYVGRLIYWKGIEYLIKSFKIVKFQHKKAHLLIIGSGPLEDSLKKVVQQQRLNDSVTFLGTVPSSIINKYYSICDVHVAPSIVTKDMIEIFGMVYLEAMASGKPSIAFDIPAGVRNIIIDGETGFLVPEKDIESLAEKICVLLSDEKKKVLYG